MPQSRRQRREAERERELAEQGEFPTDGHEYTPIAHHGRLGRAGGGPAAFLKWAALGLTMALVGSLTLAGLLVWSVQKDIAYFDLPTADGSPQIASLDGPVNLLLVGSDTRAGQGDGFTAENKTSDLADVIMLLHVSADHQTATAVSFPRDLMVGIPACPKSDGGTYPALSRAQINSSIEFGGVGCTALTVEKLTGIDIGFAAKIDFKGVIEMTNAIGGVTVCVSDAINDPDSGLDLPAGESTIQGADALAFLRNRHGVGDGSDLGRISSQQVYLSSLVRKIKDAGTLTNPVQLYDLASAAARNIQFSSNLADVSTLASLAQTVARVDLENVSFIQAPVATDPRDHNRVVLDQTLSKPLFELIASGDGVRLSDNTATGRGAEVVGGAPSASESPTSSAAPSPDANAPSSGSTDGGITTLPDGIIGQTAQTRTCAKANK